MRRPAARVLSTRSRQPLGFGPNRVVVCCFWVAFHIYHQTPHRARWEAPIRLFPVRGPPGQLQKSLPQAPPASACVPLGRMAEAKGLKSRTWALEPMPLIQDGFRSSNLYKLGISFCQAPRFGAIAVDDRTMQAWPVRGPHVRALLRRFAPPPARTRQPPLRPTLVVLLFAGRGH